MQQNIKGILCESIPKGDLMFINQAVVNLTEAISEMRFNQKYPDTDTLDSLLDDLQEMKILLKSALDGKWQV